MSLETHLPAFSLGISQIPVGRDTIKIEEQEPLPAYLPIPDDDQPHTALQPELFKAEDVPVCQQQEPQGWSHNENGAAATESAPENQDSSVSKGEEDGEFDEDISNDEETAHGLGVSVSDSITDKKRMKRFRYDSDSFSTFQENKN